MPGSMKTLTIAAIATVPAVVLAAGGITAAAMLAPSAAPHTVTRTITHTQIAYRTRTVTRWKTRTVTNTVSVPDSGAITCIDALYNNLSFDAANGHVLPNGWWDERCIPYTP